MAADGERESSRPAGEAPQSRLPADPSKAASAASPETSSETPGEASALRIPWFRLYAALTLLSGIGTLAEDVPRRWLAKAMTDRLFTVGALGFASNFGDLLSGFVFSVRRESPDLARSLAIVQSLLAVIAVALAILAGTGVLEAWHLLVAAFATGALYAPARAMGAALAVRAVPRESAASAMAVLSTAGSLARLAGPPVGGLLLGAAGAAAVFAMNAASFVPLILMLVASAAALRGAGGRSAGPSSRPGIVPSAPAPAGTFRRALLCLLAPGLVGIPYITVFPGIAQAMGGADAGKTWLGWLYSALGAGSFVGATIAVARAKRAAATPSPRFAALALAQAAGVLAVSQFAQMPFAFVVAAIAAVAAVNAFYLARLGAVVGWIARDGDGSRTFARFYMVLLGAMAVAEPAVGALADAVSTATCLRVLAGVAAAVSVVFAVTLSRPLGKPPTPAPA